MPKGKALFLGAVMTFKAQLMTQEEMDRALKRIAHQILEHNAGCENVVLLGIRRRGVSLAEKLAGYILQIEGAAVPVGTLDITLYRDDLTELSAEDGAVVNKSSVDFSIKGKTVILVDDVIYTGRTVRAAMEAVLALGRPSGIQLAILIDRGHRELPIRPDYVGKNVPTARSEIVSVKVDEFDGCTCVDLYES